MADYYPLLSRAVAGLDPNTPEARQIVFERARLALTRQMASMDPPVPQPIVDREINALADAMKRVEEELEAAAAIAPKPAPEPVAKLAPIAPADIIPVPSPAAEAIEPPRQARPQVKRKDNQGKRNPLLAVGAALGIVAVAAIATLAFLRRHEPPAVVDRPAATAPATPQAPAGTKPEERVTPNAAEGTQRPVQPAQVPQNQPSAAGNAQPAPPAQPPAQQQIAVANRMMMIIQNKDDPQKVDGRPGSVVWRTEMVSGGQGQAPQLAIRATVDVPEARTRVDITIQRNRDQAFPASHTFQVQFSSTGTSELGAIQNLNQIEFRQVENQTGYALAGQGIAVMENVFLVALSRVEPAQTRNIEMMRSRPFVYLEFQAAGGRRGGMLLEKGFSGQQAFDDAFRNWQ